MVHQPLVPQPISHLDFRHAVDESTELSFPEVLAHMANPSGDFVLRDVERDAPLSFPSPQHVKV